MIEVVTAQGARERDRYLIDSCEIPGFVLMENAARSVTEKILAHEGEVLIVCGTGNNGGDGFCILRQLAMFGRYATCIILGDVKKVTGDALCSMNAAHLSNLKIHRVNSAEAFREKLYGKRFDIIVDAIFGTGLCREITGLYAECIKLLNEYTAYRVAVDIPSGVSADDGKILGCAFRADVTVTFQNMKRGHLLYPGRSFCGEVFCCPISFDDRLYFEYMSEEKDIPLQLPKRRADSHKGTYGKVLIIGGCDEYAGACLLSAVSAQRSGAGLVKVICKRRAADAILQVAPEIMTVVTDKFDDNIKDLDKHIAWADAIAFGMGAGHDEGMERLLSALLSTKKPLIIDADGINCMAEHKELLNKLHGNCLLTPHVGEFSRLTGLSAEEITDDFAECAKTFAKEYHTNLHLKSAVSITASDCGTLGWNVCGNTGLAKGGSGDTLSGLIASLCAQGESIASAAELGALILGVCAEKCNLPVQTMTATDISRCFAMIFNKQ